VGYARHAGRDGKPDSMRVDYYDGLRRVASEWVCFEHGGFAGEKARQWWIRRSNNLTPASTPSKTEAALDDAVFLSRPSAITVNETGRYPEVIGYEWNTDEHQSTDRVQGRIEEQAV
jgi:DNA repair protein RadD